MHSPPPVINNSVRGLGSTMHSGSSMLSSVEGHALRRHSANTHTTTCPGASSRVAQKRALTDGQPDQYGSKQPYVLAPNTACSSPKFGGLLAPPGCAFAHLNIDHVRA